MGICSVVLQRINFEHMPEKDRIHTMQEVKFLQEMDHPNIVKYKDHLQDDQNLYIIMGYCEGGDLHSKIKEASKKGEYFAEVPPRLGKHPAYASSSLSRFSLLLQA